MSRHGVRLTETGRQSLEDWQSRGRRAVATAGRARMPWKTDASAAGPAWPDGESVADPGRQPVGGAPGAARVRGIPLGGGWVPEGRARGTRKQLVELAGVQAQRFFTEHSFPETRQEVGLAGYQVRRWDAGHHPMALVMLSTRLLAKQKASGRNPWPSSPSAIW